MTELTWNSDSAEATANLGNQLAALLRADDVVILSGDLGAGKTQFTKGIAEGLGITDTVTSPSFVLRNDYQGTELALAHFDVYRLGSIHDLDVLDLDETDANQVVIIEWGEGVSDYIRSDHIEIRIMLPDFDDAHLDDSYRSITVTPRGTQWEDRIPQLRAIGNSLN